LKTSIFIARRLTLSSSRSFTRVVIGIAVVGLALSLCVMIVSTAIISGFKSEINSKIFGFWGHIHISDASSLRDFDLKPISIDSVYYGQLKKIQNVEYQVPKKVLGYGVEGEFESASTIGGVASTSPFIVMPCLLETKKEMVAGLFKGVTDEFDWVNMKRFMVEGEGLNAQDSTNQVVISKNIANKLSIKSGNKIIITFIKDNAKFRRAFVIKGVYNTGLEEYDRRFIIGQASKMQELLGWEKHQFSGIEVFAQHPKDMSVLNDYMYTNLLPSNIYSATVEEKFPNIFEWLKLQDINEKVILELMIIVAIINLITVLLILILERTKMVGVLKAIGASNWTIRSIFIYHASFILLMGLILGNVLGIGFCLLQKYSSFFKLDEQNYYLDTVPIELNWFFILLLNLGAFIICFLTLIIPSILVSKIKPVRALKFD
jgi:lipoprotein-releasing system permease protein